MPTLLTGLIFLSLTAATVIPYVLRMRRNEARAREASRQAGAAGARPRAQHPRVDPHACIGCGACAAACPEGETLAVVAGRAVLVHPERCIGHGLCAEACPVEAIRIVLGDSAGGVDRPRLSGDLESSVPGLFIIGELGGLTLIRNAVNQGRESVDHVARRLQLSRRTAGDRGVLDLCIVGAGPAGISASLRAVERKLSYLTLEQDEFGGTVAKFPRRKLVMTSPVEFPLYGRFGKLELSKEDLLRFWEKVARRADLRMRARERVEGVRRGSDGLFTVKTAGETVRARHVILAMGRRGTPRKLGIPGEERSKVMYGLLDAEGYRDARIVVVGGGDSAVEAALGLALQPGNQVVLSYRGDSFHRIKPRNARRLEEARAGKSLKVVLNSNLAEIRETSVVLDEAGRRREMANDFVWIFAGGTLPDAFLKEAGVAVGSPPGPEEGRETGTPQPLPLIRDSSPSRPESRPAGTCAAGRAGERGGESRRR